MAVRVRQPYMQPQQQPQYEPQQPSVKPSKEIVKQPKKRFTLFEKCLFLLFIVVFAYFAVSILHTQGELQTMSMEIQKIETEIQEVSNQNVDLKVRVSELSTYERIWEKAKELGLTLNENNVKVVPGQ